MVVFLTVAATPNCAARRYAPLYSYTIRFNLLRTFRPEAYIPVAAMSGSRRDGCNSSLFHHFSFETGDYNGNRLT